MLAIGEAHAPRGATVPSAASRFTGALLPMLAGRASDLLVELMMPPEGCAPATAAVRREQEPATSRQAAYDQSEYVAMGERARTLGIVPDMLRPTCADLDAIQSSDAGGLSASLETIARLTLKQAMRLVDRDTASEADRGKTVVIYGGAIHNDLQPADGAERWTYAPALDEHAGGRLVALDLIVPEYIGDDAAWRALPWWHAYDRARLGRRTTLLHTGDRSFVLVFPEALADGGQPSPSR